MEETENPKGKKQKEAPEEPASKYESIPESEFAQNDQRQQYQQYQQVPVFEEQIKNAGGPKGMIPQFLPYDATIRQYPLSERTATMFATAGYRYDGAKTEELIYSSYGVVQYILSTYHPDNYKEEKLTSAFAFLMEWVSRGHSKESLEKAARDSINVKNYPPPDFSGPVITEELVGLMDQAREVEKMTEGRKTESKKIGSRHLVAAFFMYEHPGSEVWNWLLNLSLSKQEFFNDYFEFLREPNYPRDNLEAWAQLLDVSYTPEKPKGKDSIVALQIDAPTGEDLLDVEEEAKAFAKLIASRQVPAPLSLGIFGVWGSGKSFFMGKIREFVNELTTARQKGPVQEERSGDPLVQKTGSFREHIVQIEFNAWHFVDANLWASLVTHIFEELENFGKDPDERKRVREALYQKLETSYALREELAQREMELQTRRVQLEEELTAKKEARKKFTLSNVKDTVTQAWTAIKEEAQKEKTDAETEAELINLNWNEDIVKKARSLGISQAELMKKRVDEVVAEVEEIKAGGKLTWSWLRSRPAWETALFLLIVVGVAVGGVFLALKIDKTQEFLQPVLAFLGPAALIAFRTLAGSLNHLRKAKQLITKVNDIRGSFETRLNAFEKEAENLARVDSEIEALEAEIQELEDSREDARSELREIITGRKLANFIKDRANSQDYRQHLGIISLIRKDFQLLSELLVEQEETRLELSEKAGIPAKPSGELLRRREMRRQKSSQRIASLKNKLEESLVTGTSEGAVEAQSEKVDRWKEELDLLALNDEEITPQDLMEIERIVLYIDDLDRCPSDKVVEVLQAVHLLMSFPLFVVVVGVDARWVKQALQDNYDYMKEYEELVREADTLAERYSLYGKAATPFDYLEKIFQVPFWVKPMETEAAQKFISGLVKGDLSAEKKEQPDPGTGEEGTLQPRSTLESLPLELENKEETAEETREGDAAPRETPAAEVSVTDVKSKSEKAPRLILPLQKVTPTELAIMRLLAPVLGTTPRTAKRFLNTFRLVKAKFEWGPESDKTGWDEKLAAMLALGIIITCPGIAEDLFREMNRHNKKHKKRLTDRPDPKGKDMTPEPTLDFLRLTDFLDHGQAEKKRLDEMDVGGLPPHWLNFLYHPEWDEFEENLQEIFKFPKDLEAPAEVQASAVEQVKLDRLLVWYNRVIRYSFRIIQPID